jgi:hypothetical protein
MHIHRGECRKWPGFASAFRIASADPGTGGSIVPAYFACTVILQTSRRQSGIRNHWSGGRRNGRLSNSI